MQRRFTEIEHHGKVLGSLDVLAARWRCSRPRPKTPDCVSGRGVFAEVVDWRDKCDRTEFSLGTVKRTLQTVPGIGYATANYFLMLMGSPRG